MYEKRGENEKKVLSGKWKSSVKILCLDKKYEFVFYVSAIYISAKWHALSRDFMYSYANENDKRENIWVPFSFFILLHTNN